MNMIELPPLAQKSKGNLIVRDIEEDKDTLMLRMNGCLKVSNLDSSASSTSKSLSSGGLLVKRSKTSNNLSQDGRLGTLFENSRTPPARRPQRTMSNQRLSNRSEYGSTTTGLTRSNMATIGSQYTVGPKRCVSYNDMTRMDKNNNRGIGTPIGRGHLNRHKSEQKLSTTEKNDKKQESSDPRVPEAENEDDKERRILDWLQNVEQYAEPPPEIPDEIVEERVPPQTDTAIHIVYEGDHR